MKKVESIWAELSAKAQEVENTQEVELSEPDNGGAASRTSLSVDSQNEVQIRTNNSFLHDNVD